MADFNKPLVFIVEDNNAYRILISRVLQKHGFMVLMFENGKKALDMLKYVKPTLILSDIDMPVMDGFEFHEKVKETYSEDIPFIYLSSTSEKDEQARATSLGAIGMLSKPVMPDTLTKSIESVLDAAVVFS